MTGAGGWDTGTYTVTIKPANGPAMKDSGKYLVLPVQGGGSAIRSAAEAVTGNSFQDRSDGELARRHRSANHCSR